MSLKFSELQRKEVICVSDGRRLGFVCDVCLEVPEGRVLSLTVPGPGRCWGLLGCREEYVIPWSSICRIGPDIILADIRPEDCKVPKAKPGFFF